MSAVSAAQYLVEVWTAVVAADSQEETFQVHEALRLQLQMVGGTKKMRTGFDFDCSVEEKGIFVESDWNDLVFLCFVLDYQIYSHFRSPSVWKRLIHLHPLSVVDAEVRDYAWSSLQLP